MADYLLGENGDNLLLESGDLILLESDESVSTLPTGLILFSKYPAFINNSVLIGKLTISGTTSAGTNTQTFNVDLGFSPDIIDIMFNGNSGSSRPDAAWFRQGTIDVGFTGPGNSVWYLSGKVSGSTLVVTATYVQTFVGTETLTTTDFSYRVSDYTIF